MKKTSFKITSNMKFLEMEILKISGLTLTAFHRKAIDFFIASGGHVSEKVKITQKKHPDYIEKPYTEQIYLEDEKKEQLLEIAKREDCGITFVLFQALYDYCIEWSPIIPSDVIQQIIQK